METYPIFGLVRKEEPKRALGKKRKNAEEKKKRKLRYSTVFI